MQQAGDTEIVQCIQASLLNKWFDECLVKESAL